MFSFDVGVNSPKTGETISDFSCYTYTAFSTPITTNSVESVVDVDSENNDTNKKVNMLYENLLRDVVHDQSLTGKKQFNNIQDLIIFADNKFKDEVNISNAKDSDLLHKAYLEKIRLIEYDKQLFQHICNKKEISVISSDVDKDWYNKTKNWLLGKSLTEDVSDKKTSCSVEKFYTEETKKEEKIRYSPTTLDRGADFKPIPAWWEAKDAKDPDLSKKRFLTSKYPFLPEHHKEKNRVDDKNNNQE